MHLTFFYIQADTFQYLLSVYTYLQVLYIQVFIFHIYSLPFSIIYSLYVFISRNIPKFLFSYKLDSSPSLCSGQNDTFASGCHSEGFSPKNLGLKFLSVKLTWQYKALYDINHATGMPTNNLLNYN